MDDVHAPVAPPRRPWRMVGGLLFLALAGWVAAPHVGPLLPRVREAVGSWACFGATGFDPCPQPVPGDRPTDASSDPMVGAPVSPGAPSVEPSGGHVFRHAIPDDTAVAKGDARLPIARFDAQSPPPLPPRNADGLPAVPSFFGAPPPAFGERYRTTLRMPPPPLLDPQRVTRSVAEPSRGPQPIAVARQRAVATHVVCDGDDLTGIAIRVYGDPAMADAILGANRDRLRNPAILPIGLTLVLPDVKSGGQSGAAPKGRSGWLEPPSG